jgi:hypothetical protein
MEALSQEQVESDLCLPLKGNWRKEDINLPTQYCRDPLFSMEKDELLGRDLFELLPGHDGALKEAFLDVRNTGHQLHIPSINLNYEPFEGPFEIHAYKLPCGEIVSIFYRIGGTGQKVNNATAEGTGEKQGA